MSYRKHLMTSDEPPSELYNAVELGTNLAEVGTDLISRQAAIEALAKNMPSWTTPDGSGQFDHDIQVTDEAYVDCMQIIHDMPSAQPDIIRCKDCKHFKQVFAPNDNDGLCGHWHSKYDARTSREGYCSHAERKEVTE